MSSHFLNSFGTRRGPVLRTHAHASHCMVFSATLWPLAVALTAVLAAHWCLSRGRLAPAAARKVGRGVRLTAHAGRPPWAATMAQVAPSVNGFLPACVPDFDGFGGELQRVVEVRKRGGAKKKEKNAPRRRRELGDQGGQRAPWRPPGGGGWSVSGLIEGGGAAGEALERRRDVDGARAMLRALVRSSPRRRRPRQPPPGDAPSPRPALSSRRTRDSRTCPPTHSSLP